MLTELNDIETTQSNPMEYTLQEYQQLMDYTATYSQVIVRYYVSDMILNIDSNATYLVLANDKSYIAGYYYLFSDHINILLSNNTPILIVCKTLKHVVSSTTEAETVGVFTIA